MSFTDLAYEILGSNLLLSDDKKVRIAEIEFYLHSKDHLDEYTHKDELQAKKGWYLHRYKNGTFKNGTFRGLDRTLGSEGVYFGILIRGIISEGKHIEGPCNSVNEMMRVLGIDDLSTFNSLLPKFTFEYVEKPEIFSGPRIGLSDKYPDYRLRSYRFCVGKDGKAIVKKGKRSMTKCE